MPGEPLRVAIVNDYEIVVAGVAAALQPFADRVRVVEVDSSVPVISDVDVVLHDSFGQVDGVRVDLEDLVRAGGTPVVVFSWRTEPSLVERALALGAAGYIPKQLPAEDIVRSLEAVAAGRTVRPGPTARDQARRETRGAGGSRGSHAWWPGRDQGLSARESEVIALISQGLSNQAIAEQTYLSINSVKTYIRSGYRKIGAKSRAQAVIWGLENGFAPDRSRRLDPDGRQARDGG